MKENESLFSGDALQNVTRPSVDWTTTGRKLCDLRLHDYKFRKAVCSILRNDGACCRDCSTCDKLSMDHHVTQDELAKVMNVSSSVVHNWESGRSEPHLEYLLWYSELAGCNIYDLLIFETAPKHAPQQ